MSAKRYVYWWAVGVYFNLLRLPSPALTAFTDHQPHRITDRDPDDGLKLGLEAQKHWRRLQGFELIPKIITGVRFIDGEEQTQQAA